MQKTHFAFVQPLINYNRNGCCLYTTFINRMTKVSVTSPKRKQRSNFFIYACEPNFSQTSELDPSFIQLEKEIREYLATCADDVEKPLDYINLQQADRLDLVNRIMEAGGSSAVSERLGISFNKEEESKTLSFSIEMNKFSSQDDLQASISLGTNLEDRLNEIDQVVKNPKSLKNSNSITDRRNSGYNADKVPSARQIVEENDTLLPPVVDKIIPKDERLNLTYQMRIGLIFLTTSTAIGFGKAGEEIVNIAIRSNCQTIATGLTIAHILLSVYAGIILAPQLNRNSFIWFVKVLLSGPVGVLHLRGLSSLEDFSKDAA